MTFPEEELPDPAVWSKETRHGWVADPAPVEIVGGDRRGIALGARRQLEM